ncbi:MAG: hypothetical protein K9J83_04365 [Desulfarculaceae bacterium]|nr:hypothetical protein [Desulfarculaceae bacterium]
MVLLFASVQKNDLPCIPLAGLLGSHCMLRKVLAPPRFPPAPGNRSLDLHAGGGC